jgi:hypothetical protein
MGIHSSRFDYIFMGFSGFYSILGCAATKKLVPAVAVNNPLESMEQYIFTFCTIYPGMSCLKGQCDEIFNSR